MRIVLALTAIVFAVGGSEAPAAGPGLVAAFSFDEGRGAVASDSSGNARTGAIVGGTWVSNGKYGGALSFDGNGARVDLPSLGTFYKTGFTLEAWVKKTGAKRDVAVVGTWVAEGDGGPMVWVDHIDGDYYLTLNKGTPSVAYLDTTRTPVAAEWHHVAATYDDATARFYVDGALVASKPFTGDVGNSDTWRIGAYGSGPYGFFDGLIDEVRIYDRALTGEEIQNDANTSVDTIAPGAPTGFATTATGATTLGVGWNPATDDIAVAGYRLLRNGSVVGTTSSTSFTFTGAACSTTYDLSVQALDAAGNASAMATLSASTTACDTTPPTVAVTAPSDGASVTGTIALAATASDDDAVTGVEFRVDGLSIAPEDTTAPYSVSWDTRGVANGTHTLTASTRDASGNTATSAPVAFGVQNLAVPPGLLAAYSFDDAEGTMIRDDSGNGNNGSAFGALTAAGKYGTALSYDGFASRVNLPPLGRFYRSGFTFEAWVNKQGAKKDGAVLGTWVGSEEGGPMIWVDHISGRYYLTLNAGAPGTYLDSGRTPATGQWQHLAATYDGTTARLYVDGAEVASKPFTGSIGDSNTWQIGAYGPGPTGFFDGLIDEVRIYARALTAADVRVDMNRSLGPPDAVAPSIPTHFVRTGANATSISTSWSPSTDDVAVAGYNLFLGGVKVGSTAATHFAFDKLVCNTPYNLAVEAYDEAGNVSDRAVMPGISTTTCDSVPPTVTLTAPAAGTVSGTIAVTATASDGDAVAGVQFLLDGNPLGLEDATAPYSVSWDTRAAANGPHTVAARARDASGNDSTADTVPITVDNGDAPPPGLRAAYGFDDGAGSALVDVTGNGNTGLVIGAAWTTGRFGSGLSFGGNGDRVDLPQLGTFYRSAFTYEAWVKKAGTKRDVALLGSWVGSRQGGPMIWVDHVSGRYYLTLNAGSLSSYLDSGREPAVGQWQHVAATYDGTEAHFYVNGVLVASTPFAGNVGDSNTWRIGAYDGASATGFFDGIVDEVRIYDRALAAGEIQTDMTVAVGALDRTPPTTPTGFATTSVATTSLQTGWNASTDSIGVAGYNVYREGAKVGTTSSTTFSHAGLTCDTPYAMSVEAFDAAGNVSGRATLSTRTGPCDIQPPVVTMTAPASGASVSSSVTVSATATDNDALAGVQFKVDGSPIGAEDPSAPFAISWDTRTAAGGPHAITATARDLSGNQATAAAVSVTVDNGAEPPPGLVAAYAFDEGLGQAVSDSSGSGNEGTAESTTWAVGRHGTALTFNGSSSLVTVPDSSSLDLTTAMTLEAWVLPTALGTSWRTVVFKEQPGNVVYDLYAGTSTSVPSTSIYVAGSEVEARGAGALALNQWSHLAATYDGAMLRLYVNGVLVRSKSVSGPMPTSSSPLRIGGNSIFPEWFEGRIDDVRIYDRALTPSEIADDMATAAARDTDPPRIESVTPEDDAAEANVGVKVRATFSEAIDPASVTTQSFALHDPSGAVVPATVSYDDVGGKATLNVASALSYGTRYTATIQGGSGPSAVKDLAGNPLGADRAWSFTTDPPPPPILVIGSTANEFTNYYTEILRAEGLNAFSTTDVSFVSPSLLDFFDVAILGEIPLTTNQVTILSDWVTRGGNLIVMRPDKQLAGLLGLRDADATLSNAYLSVDNSSAPGTGIVGETIQYHGGADLYTLAGASAVARLYSTSTATTPNPAVSLRSVGAAGGQAAAFSYDLAKSIVLTRQGNPAWAGQERDGIFPIRPNDLFFGAAAGDVRPDWVDTTKIGIPQADEQQRLLANLILDMTRDATPIPRFWYLPRGEKAAVIMSGDDHGEGGTAGRFDQYKALSPPNCSVVLWECVRATSYVYTSGPLTDGQAAAYEAQGFEIALHVNPAGGPCANWTPDRLEQAFADQLQAFEARYPSVSAPTTNRTHCVAWSDWSTQPRIEARRGIKLDFNYYAYPGSWIGSLPGFMTGSGLIMPFTDADGTLLDTYQALTQVNDESLQPEPATINTLLDRALGAEGYYGFFGVNMHTDEVDSPGSDAIVASAVARGVPVISAKQALQWVQARNASSFTGFSWGGGTLGFDIRAAAGAAGLQAMLPLQTTAGSLRRLERGGHPVPFTTETLEGVDYAVFSAVSASYTATYAP